VRLSTRIHDRDSAGLTYVYPVVSRRARGVSVGVNLNTNNACNWRCVYCQVPGLVLGKAPETDLGLLERELREMLAALVDGDYLERHVPPGARRINDVAFSGNGEPTSSAQLPEAIDLVARALARFELVDRVKIVLITNGSLIHKPAVQDALRRLSRANGEVWFKLDSATDAGQERINSVRTGVERTRRNLRTCAELCPTWIQTMAFATRGAPPEEGEVEAYLAFLRNALASGVVLRGVHLYGLARRSWQPEAADLSPLPAAWLERFAERIRACGVAVELSL